MKKSVQQRIKDMSTVDMDKLLPCPFCGGKNLHFEGNVVTPDDYHSGAIRCRDCGVTGPDSLEATDAWDTNATDAEQHAATAWIRRAEPPKEKP